MKKSQLFNLLEYSLENILAGGWGVGDLPSVITDLLNTLKEPVSKEGQYKTIKEHISTWLDGFQGGHFSKSTVIEEIDELYTDPTKKDIKPLLSNLINKAVDTGLDHSDFPLCNLEEFLEDGIEEIPIRGNIIEIDCKVDMAIPKEDLQKNLQLLIDRQGVQWLSTVIDSLANQKAIQKEYLESSQDTVLGYLHTLGIMVSDLNANIKLGYAHYPIREGGRSLLSVIDTSKPSLDYHIINYSLSLDNHILNALVANPTVFKEVNIDTIKNLVK